MGIAKAGGSSPKTPSRPGALAGGDSTKWPAAVAWVCDPHLHAPDPPASGIYRPFITRNIKALTKAGAYKPRENGLALPVKVGGLVNRGQSNKGNSPQTVGGK